MIGHFVSNTVHGETCSICYAMGESAGGGRVPATHKVGEEIANDEPIGQIAGLPVPDRHNFTAYVCCDHFRLIMGRAVFCPAATKEVPRGCKHGMYDGGGMVCAMCQNERY